MGFVQGLKIGERSNLRWNASRELIEVQVAAIEPKRSSESQWIELPFHEHWSMTLVDRLRRFPYRVWKSVSDPMVDGMVPDSWLEFKRLGWRRGGEIHRANNEVDGVLMKRTTPIQRGNEPSSTENSNPHVGARIARQPVRFQRPVGSVGGGVQIHQSRDCSKAKYHQWKCHRPTKVGEPLTKIHVGFDSHRRTLPLDRAPWFGGTVDTNRAKFLPAPCWTARAGEAWLESSGKSPESARAREAP